MLKSSLNEILNDANILSNKDPIESLLELQLLAHKNASNNNNSNNESTNSQTRKDCLLQNVDLYRLRALVYRDVVRNERNKAKPFVIVVLTII